LPYREGTANNLAVQKKIINHHHLLNMYSHLKCFVHTIFFFQSGHNIEKVREKMGELIKQMVTIYSLPKLLPYILEGLRSKNNRTRIECVDIVGYFIDHHGTEVWISNFLPLLLDDVPTYRRCLLLFMQVSGLMKNLPSVAALTAERDGETRKAALNTLATAYKNLGMPLDIFYLMLFYNTFLLPFLFVLSQTHSFL
jgi:hypothetical protein